MLPSCQRGEMYNSSILSGMIKILFPYTCSSLFHWHPKTYCVTVNSFCILTVTWMLGGEEKFQLTSLSEIRVFFSGLCQFREQESWSSLLGPLSRGQPESPRHRPQEPQLSFVPSLFLGTYHEQENTTSLNQSCCGQAHASFPAAVLQAPLVRELLPLRIRKSTRSKSLPGLEKSTSNVHPASTADK